jgi:hypothetical protein
MHWFIIVLTLNEWRMCNCIMRSFITCTLSSSSIIRTIKSRRMGWEGHVARMGEKRNGYRIMWENHIERDHWEDQDVGGWPILKWILET